MVSSITGLDTEEAVIAEARKRASEASLDDRVRYFVADAGHFLDDQRGLDAVFFHASLHHFDNPPAILARVNRALRSGGIVYLEEYVGPARREWTWKRMLLLNVVFRLLPARLRRTRLVRKPVNPEDPSEAVASSAIPSAVEEHLKVLSRRDCGGNLLAVIYPNLVRPGRGVKVEEKEFDECISFLLDLEDVILEHGKLLGESSFYSVILAEKRE